MDDIVTTEFRRGVDAYWSGERPDAWDDGTFNARLSSTPFLMGWHMAALWETHPGVLQDEDGNPLQEDD